MKTPELTGDLAERLAGVAPMLVLDLEAQRVAWTSPALAEALGLASGEHEDLLGEVVYAPDLPRFRAHLERLRGLPDGQTAEVELRVRRADGT